MCRQKFRLAAYFIDTFGFKLMVNDKGNIIEAISGIIDYLINADIAYHMTTKYCLTW